MRRTGSRCPSIGTLPPRRQRPDEASLSRAPGTTKRHAIPPKSVHRRSDTASPAPAWLRTAPLRSRRSEEHTSELQSLMRISYAVFCLKKKKMKISKAHTTHNNTHQRD